MTHCWQSEDVAYIGSHENISAFIECAVPHLVELKVQSPPGIITSDYVDAWALKCQPSCLQLHWRTSNLPMRQGLQKWWPQGVERGSFRTPLHRMQVNSRRARSCSFACTAGTLGQSSRGVCLYLAAMVDMLCMGECEQVEQTFLRAFLGEEFGSLLSFWLTGGGRVQPHSFFASS